MKTLSLCAVLLFSIFNTQFSFAQKSTTLSIANIKVWGNCESCKKRIETAAKKAGATYALWDEETKNLNIKYKSAKTSPDKIQAAIAAKGYDTQDYTAAVTAYNNLPACCKYDRNIVGTDSLETTKCCTNEECTSAMGSCKGMECCKDKTCCAENGEGMKCGKTKGCCKKHKT